jgi:hypothetical protein
VQNTHCTGTVSLGDTHCIYGCVWRGSVIHKGDPLWSSIHFIHGQSTVDMHIKVWNSTFICISTVDCPCGLGILSKRTAWDVSYRNMPVAARQPPPSARPKKGPKEVSLQMHVARVQCTRRRRSLSEEAAKLNFKHMLQRSTASVCWGSGHSQCLCPLSLETRT